MNKEVFIKDSYLIWGGVPIDIEWAMNTLVYKQFIQNKNK